MEAQNRQVRKDFKEMKIREARTMTDYSELEEENVILQKHLAGLKQAQVRHIIVVHHSVNQFGDFSMVIFLHEKSEVFFCRKFDLQCSLNFFHNCDLCCTYNTIGYVAFFPAAFLQFTC